MQIKTMIIVQRQKLVNKMRDIYAQTMENKLHLLDLYTKRMINTPDLIEFRIHFKFDVVNRSRISILLLENPKIEITQTIVAP